MNTTSALTCRYHPETKRERAGDVERVVVGRPCEARVSITVTGNHKLISVQQEVIDLSELCGWHDGYCLDHAVKYESVTKQGCSAGPNCKTCACLKAREAAGL